MFSIIRVQLAGSIREYSQDIAGYGRHIADGGETVSLCTAQAQAKEFFRGDRDGAWRALSFWVTLDDSNLAYRVEIGRTGHHLIKAAAPLPGPGNVREVYVA